MPSKLPVSLDDLSLILIFHAPLVAIAKKEYSKRGRGMVVLILTMTGEPRLDMDTGKLSKITKEIRYAPQKEVEEFFTGKEQDGNARRMVREYLPESQFVVLLFDQTGSYRTYRIGFDLNEEATK